MNRLDKWLPLSGERTIRMWLLLALVVGITQLQEPLGDVTAMQSSVFWIGRVLGFVASFSLAEHLLRVFGAGRWATPEWLKPVVLVTMVATGPLTMLEIGLESLVPQRSDFDDSGAAFLVAAISEYVTFISVLLPANLALWFVMESRNSAGRDAISEQIDEPQFLEKTQGVRASDVLALEADEHYVRVHVDGGSEMIHHRFGDAVDAMPAALGLRTHRSWWVADSAVVGAERNGKRYRLELTGGVSVPVSDSWLQAVRARGLLRRKMKKPRQTNVDGAFE